MHFEEHLLIGWHLSQFSGLGRHERIAITLCSVVPDIDALPRLAGQDWYNRLHHTFGHCLLFGGLLMVGAYLYKRAQHARHRRCRLAFFVGLAFLAHLAADLIGTRWGLYLWWPFSGQALMSPYGWWLGAWQNRAVLLGLLGLAIPSMLHFRHSPLELLNEDLDRLVTASVVTDLRPTAPCQCSRVALGRCTQCQQTICGRCTMLSPSFAPLCPRCSKGQKDEKPKDLCE